MILQLANTDDKSLQVIRRLKEKILFTRNNLTKDVGFTVLDRKSKISQYVNWLGQIQLIARSVTSNE